jgi:hypothetical protein
VSSRKLDRVLRRLAGSGRGARVASAGFVAVLLAASGSASAQQERDAPQSESAPTGVPRLAQNSPPPSAEDVRAALKRAIGFLLGAQNADGSFGGLRNMAYTDFWPNVEAERSWTVGSSSLCAMALMREGPRAGDGERAKAAVERAVAYVVANHDLRRCDDWDIDDVWGLLYGTELLSNALVHPWFAEAEERAAITAAAQRMLERIAYYQSPTGGWGYYADQIDGWRPQWSTSFTTAAMVGALCDARSAGLTVDAKRLEAAVRAVARCRLPNGAFTYDVMALPEPGSLESINDLRGSLSRIQVCNLALVRGGRSPGQATLARGVDEFFRHHMYLDCARMRPIPHEAYHKNAGYFYLFGHFYLGELLSELPPAARRDAAGKLAFEVIKTQEKSGASWDFWMSDHARCYGTAFAAMALGRALTALSAPTD